MQAVVEALPRSSELRGESMGASDEVATMVRLKALGWGVRRIARELGCSHMTVRRYLEAGGWIGLSPAATSDEAGGAGGVAGRAVPAPSRQRRRRSPGARARAWDRRVAAHGRAGSAGAAPRAGGRGPGHGSVRDAAWAAAADRLRLDHGRHRRRDRARASCSWRRSGSRGATSSPPSATSARVLGLTASSARSSTSAACLKSCCSTTPRHWSPITTRGPARSSSTTASMPSPLLGRPAAGLCALPRADQGEGRARRRLCEANAIAGRDFASWAALKRISSHWMREVADRASTARSARRRSSVSTVTRRRRCGRCRLARPSVSSAR